MTGEAALKELTVLAADAQATAANQAQGVLMELGWAVYRPGLYKDIPLIPVKALLARHPQGAAISRRVTKLTGISPEELENGVSPLEAWSQLMSDAQSVQRENGWSVCPAIVHFSRFEEPYFRMLHELSGVGGPFPLDLICTHQIMKRLFPAIPRKGLRAAAGFLGYSTPELRRSGGHVAATLFIWEKLIRLLTERGVTSWNGLKDWLSEPEKRESRIKPEFLISRETRLALPDAPGVYRMFRSNGDILYIGKAASLKTRVSGYFRQKGGHAAQTMEMATQAARLEVTSTASALEAALLEHDEIKKYAPPYNVALRSREQPPVFFTRDLSGYSHIPDEQHVIGPLPSVEVFLPFGFTPALLTGGRGSEAEREAMSMVLRGPGGLAPDWECYREGMRIFRERRRELLNSPVIRMGLHREPFTALMALGKELQRLKREEAPSAEEAEILSLKESGDVEDAGEREQLWEWTPEAAARTLEGVIRHGAALVRRSRWLLLLSESVLVWRTGARSGGGVRCLIIRSGQVVHRFSLKKGESAPIPPGYQRPFATRQRVMDGDVYDRLRVLTTELRRLTAQNAESNLNERGLTLCFYPGAPLDASALRKALAWL